MHTTPYSDLLIQQEHHLKEVNQNEIVKNFGNFTPDNVTVEDLGEKNSLAIKLMKDAGWN